MITGARQGTLSGLQRLVAVAMARDLSAFIIPGPEIARAHGLDIEAAGMRLAVNPRHASVLLMVGAIPPSLREAAAVIYAQMMRPRALFVLGAEKQSSLPVADVVAGLSQQDLIQGVRQLRDAFAEGAFRPDISDFDAPMLRVRIEYTCPMHPEVVQSEPGSCPKCGMNLTPREAQASTGYTVQKETDTDADMQATSGHDHNTQHGMEHGTVVEYTCPMHPEVVQSEPGSCPKCGMNLEPREVRAEPAHEHMDHDAAVEYTCPMHPEVVQSGPGSCPKCGMNLEPRQTLDTQAHEHAGMDTHSDHSAMEHADMTFMSMIDVTKDLPRSGDGLPMEWINAPFGPFFPGLPGGLLLTLTLDGDTVAESDARSLTGKLDLLQRSSLDSTNFVEQLAGMNPLAPVAYRLLACRALENAAAMGTPADVARARAGALERERIASHLGWLALFGQQTGFNWLMRHAASLQLKFQHAGLEQIMALKPDIQSLVKRLQRTPLLKSRTAGIGRLTPDTTLHGPVARAIGIDNDARSTEEIFNLLGFIPARRKEGDALARLQIRLDEITHSLALIEAAGLIELPAVVNIGEVSASGEAVVETPRGMARLRLTLKMGQVIAAQLETPSTHHLTLIDSLTEQQELGDALVAVGSLDLSPWEVQQ